MTDIEQKALELVNKNAAKGFACETLEEAGAGILRIRLLEVMAAHELDNARHAAEMREQAERFSEAVQNYYGDYPKDRMHPALSRFILAPVDPLVEALAEVTGQGTNYTDERDATALRAALDARGFAIVKKEVV